MIALWKAENNDSVKEDVLYSMTLVEMSIGYYVKVQGTSTLVYSALESQETHDVTWRMCIHVITWNVYKCIDSGTWHCQPLWQAHSQVQRQVCSHVPSQTHLPVPTQTLR